MTTLEAAFFNPEPEDNDSPKRRSQPPRYTVWQWLSSLMPVIHIHAKGQAGVSPQQFFKNMSATPPLGPDGLRRPLIPEALSRWSTGLRTPQGGGGGFLVQERWFIAGVTLFIFFWTVVYTLTAYTPRFESEAKVIIKDSAITSSYVSMPNAASQTTSSSASNPVLNMIGLINATSVRTALYDYFVQQHPDVLKKYKIRDVEDWDAFYADGQSFVKAKNIPGTDLISIQFTWNDKTIAKDSLATLLKAFQDESLNINRAEQKNRSFYLDRQVEDLAQKLATIRTQKSQYKSKMGTANLVRQGDDLTKSRLDLETQLNGLLSQAHGKEAEASRYEKMLSMTTDQAVKAAGMGLNPSITKLYDQLYSLKQNEATLKANLTDTNPRVLDVQATIQAIEAQIKQEEQRSLGTSSELGARSSTVSDPTRGQLVTQMATAQAMANSLRGQAIDIQHMLTTIQGDIRQFPVVEEGLSNLEQEERSLSNALDTLKQKALEAHIKEAETLSNIFVIDQPSMPIKAKFPTNIHILLMGLIMGFGMGTLLAFLKQKLKNNRPHDGSLEDDTLFDVLTESPARAPKTV